jgi:hypothetical protein
MASSSKVGTLTLWLGTQSSELTQKLGIERRGAFLGPQSDLGHR